MLDTDAWICLQPAPPPLIDWPADRRRVVDLFAKPPPLPKPPKPPRPQFDGRHRRDISPAAVLEMVSEGRYTVRAVAIALGADDKTVLTRLLILIASGRVEQAAKRWRAVEIAGPRRP